MRLTIPINNIQFAPYQPIQDKLLNTFVEAMGRKRDEYRWILNLNQWLFVFLTLTGRYLDLRDKLDAKDRIFGKILFSNARSATPFIGMESYLKTVKQYGIPVVQDSTSMFPAGTEANAFLGLTDQPQKDAFSRPFELILPLVLNGLKSLGVVFDMESMDMFGHEFAAALDRGVGKRRAAK